METMSSMKRRAVVTGASRGLGLEVSRQLAALDYEVVLTARTEAHAQTAASTLREQGHDVTSHVLDITEQDSVDRLFAWLDEREGRLDVLVNNAGVVLDGPRERWAGALEIPAEVVLRSFEINALGAYRMTQRAMPRMNAAGYGRVVNVSSGLGLLDGMRGGWPAYRISKAALSAVTLVFDAEAGLGVLVNAMTPGWVRTDMGGEGATRGVEEGARWIVRAATLPGDGPSGAFLQDGVSAGW